MDRMEPQGLTTDRVLIVAVIDHYGRRTIRPLNETARLFTELLNQKTLTEQDVERIKRLGFSVRTEGKEL